MKNKKRKKPPIPNKSPEKSKLSEQTKRKALIENTNIEENLSGVPFSIVGIGASAGGLEAFTALLQRLPPDTGMAFVLVQHLSPAHKSMLSEILSKKSALPVVEATDGMEVVPNHVYVIPPNTSMSIVNGFLRLYQRQSEFNEQNLPIDLFLSALAEYQKEKAIAVILSGTASDGSLGVKVVKGYGGITFAQDDTAKFDMMPKNAIATGCVDFILSPEGIAQELINLSRHPYNKAKSKIEDLIPEADTLRQILMLLRKSSGVDFTNYKLTTLKRRILRRMMLKNVDTLKNYAGHLISHPQELEILSQEVFITVTHFFRDPEIFEALRRDIFSRLIKNLPSHKSIRVWTTGCSTGEEAYSLAISLLEFLEEEDKVNTPIQIFATDVMNSAIEHARLGVYAEDIVSAVSPERLKRFFNKTDKGYQVKKSIREMCVFAKQNITADPPFSKLDLISCRNLLIYLDSAAQKRIMSILHYALNPGGFLLLGQSEGITAFPELFSVVNTKAKIYSKSTIHKIPQLMLSARVSSREAPAIPIPALLPGAPSVADVQKEADRLVLKMVHHTGVVINEAMDVVQFRGDTSRYLKHVSGTASLNLLKMVPDRLFIGIRNAIQKVLKKDVPFRTETIHVKHSESASAISIKITPFRVPLKGQRYFLVTFEEPASTVLRKLEIKKEVRPGKSKTPSSSKDLEQELESTRLHLQGLIEDKEAANEELQAANEEVVSANEELQSLNEEFQSANEELESAKEELQATNEEITTLNEELQGRNVQLTELNDYHVNLMDSINLPLVMVGRDLRVRSFTPTAEEVLRLAQGDMGRPLSDIKSDIDLQGLDITMLQAINTKTLKELELQSGKGKWYKIQIRPYRTSDNKIDGAIVTFFDVTKLKAYSVYREAIFQTIHQPLLILDAALRVKSANKIFYEKFQVGPEDTIGNLIFSLGDGQWNIPALRGSLEGLLPKKTNISNFEVRLDFPKIGGKVLLLNARQIEGQGEGGEEDSILLAIDDITERKESELGRAILETLEEEQRRIGQDLHDGLCQQLTGVALIAQALSKKISTVAPDESESALEITELINQAIDQTRDLARGFSPVEIERAGLLHALQTFAATTERLYKISCVFNHDESAEAEYGYAPALATHLYRIVQEAVNNAIRHGKAKRVAITLFGSKNPGLLKIQDDGIGFQAEDEKSPGLGLSHMRYRCKAIGAQFSIRSGEDGGTLVTCVFPRAQESERLPSSVTRL